MGPGSRSVIAVSALGAFLCSLDSALNVAFPAISADLGVSPRQIALVIVFYHVPIGILTVLGGMLGDRFGHRRVFACGVWTCAVAFPLCGFAADYGWLLAARVVQGAGTGLVYGTAPALVTLGLAPSRRGIGLGVLNFAAGVALALAPMLAGVLVDAFGWRAVFLFRIPIAVAVGIVALLPLPGMARTERPPLGARPSLSLPLIVGNVLAVAANTASFPIFIFVPYYLIDVVRESATVAGLIFMTGPASTSLGGLAGGWLTRRIEPRRLVLTGLAIETVGLFAITTLRDGSPIPFTIVAFALTGFGLGFFQTPNMTLVMAALPDRNQGLAGGMISAMRTIGVLTASLGSPWLFAVRQATHSPRIADASALFLAAFSDTFLASTVLAAAALVLALVARPYRSSYNSSRREL
jgi:MFS family permease